MLRANCKAIAKWTLAYHWKDLENDPPNQHVKFKYQNLHAKIKYQLFNIQKCCLGFCAARVYFLARIGHGSVDVGTVTQLDLNVCGIGLNRA